MDPLPLNQVVQGDCVEVLQGFPDNCIDLVVTDPPYGLSFMGKEWDKALPPIEAFKEINRVLKPGALAFVMSSPRQDLMWRMMKLLEDSGFEMKQSFISWIYKTGFPKAYDVSKGIDKKHGLEPEKIPRTDRLYEDITHGNYNRKDGKSNSTKTLYNSIPVSVDAKEWDGWKSITGLKPALEPILMVNKPLSEKTIVDNVLRWGTGAINIDACRIPINSDNDTLPEFIKTKKESVNAYGDGLSGSKRTGEESKEGRFPANLLVSDGALDTGELSKSGDLRLHHNLGKDENGYAKTNVYGKYTRIDYDFNGDIGDQSRYFDLDAWAKHHGLLDVPKPDNQERDFGLTGKKQVPKSKFNLNDGSKDERFDGIIPTPRRNTHPTVKPIKLMSYLIELGGPRDGVVMDPFVGSGTTCIAAKQLCRKYIGIELDKKYHALAEARIAAYPQPLEWFTEANIE